MTALTGSLAFDPTEAADSSSVGAFVRAGTDGDLIGSQTIAASEWLQVASAMFDGAGNALSSTGGALDVNIASGTLSLGSEYAEDSAHASAHVGQFVMSVRADDLAAVPAGILAGTEGDYQALITNQSGALYVAGVDFDIRNLSQAQDSIQAWTFDGVGNAIASTGGALDVNVTNPIDVDDDIANVAIENTATAVSTTAVNVVTSALANRKHLLVANQGNKLLYFGKNGVTTANGFPLFPREKMAVRIGPAVAPQMIGSTGSSSEDVRVMELS
jgi:hypothetical protein